MVNTEQLGDMTTMERMEAETIQQDLLVARLVREQGYPNRWGARIPVHSNWNLDTLEQRLQGYQDKEIVQWLRYGWPSGRLPTAVPPARTYKNHKGATDHPQALKQYMYTKRETGRGSDGTFQESASQRGRQSMMG